MMLPTFCVLAFLLLTQLAASQRSRDYEVRSDVHFRDVRYCEILSSRNAHSIWQFNNFTAYNSLLNGCPIEKWRQVTTKMVSAIDGAAVVVLNGPRFWAFDTVTTNSSLVDKSVTMINDIRMVVVGIVEVTYYEMFCRLIYRDFNFYKPRSVRRPTVYVFFQKKPINFLESPEGDFYVMQSYSEMAYPVNRENLPRLGELLSLPEGWTYHHVDLQHELALRAVDSIGIIVNDNFYNVYSLVDKNQLFESIGSSPLTSTRKTKEL